MCPFKRQKYPNRIKESGFTLVEVLVSVVLLTIIITIFLNIFIQSAKTNATSEELVDATYLAQIEMEKIYSESLDPEHSAPRDSIRDLDYNPLSSEEGWLFFGKSLDDDYYAKIKLQRNSMDEMEGMYRLIITIHNGSLEGKIQAQMENILVWEWEADSE